MKYMRKTLQYMVLTLVLATVLLTGIAESRAESSRDVRLRKTASQRWHKWRKNRTRFPIAAWSYFHRYESTLKDYKLYEDAGMTMVSPPPEQYGLAEQTGLDIILGHFQPVHEDEELLKSMVAGQGIDSSRIVGYSLKDEPLVGDYPGLSEAVEYVYKNDDRGAIPIMDFRPNWSVPYKRWNMTYETYFERFLDEVHPSMTLNCHYAVMRDGSTRPVYYANIEYFRKKSLEYDIGFMGFPLITAHKFPNNPNIDYRMPSESDIRWMVYTYLAYGAQGIWWYNWRIRDDRFMTSIIDGDSGEPTRYYPIVQDLNSEIQDIGQTLLSLRSTGVYHLGENTPPGTTRFADGCIPSLLGLSGDDFIAGVFEHADDPNDDSVYVMFVNKRHEADTVPQDLKAKLTFIAHPEYWDVVPLSKENGHYTIKRDKGDDNDYVVYTLSLDGGQGVLLRFSK